MHDLSAPLFAEQLHLGDINFDPYVEAQLALLTRYQHGVFDGDVTLECGTRYLACSSEGFLAEFGEAANLLRSQVLRLDQHPRDIFKSTDPSDELLKALLLLADKYRSQIDYPIRRAQSAEYFKAMLADYLVSYARSNNPAQPDLGQYIASQVSRGSANHYVYPEVVTERKTVSVAASGGPGTTTGWYALPGMPVTLTRHDHMAVRRKWRSPPAAWRIIQAF